MFIVSSCFVRWVGKGCARLRIVSRRLKIFAHRCAFRHSCCQKTINFPKFFNLISVNSMHFSLQVRVKPGAPPGYLRCLSVSVLICIFADVTLLFV